MKRWILLVVVAALVTAAAVATVAVAAGGDDSTGWVDRGIKALQQDGDGAGVRACGEDGLRAGATFGAIEDPELREAVEALREQHRVEMRAWWERYSDAPRSDVAQEALQALRDQHREELRAVFEKYGVELPEGAHFGDGGRARAMFGAGEDGACGAGAGPGMPGSGRSSW
jgi:hypothetical protein